MRADGKFFDLAFAAREFNYGAVEAVAQLRAVDAYRQGIGTANRAGIFAQREPSGAPRHLDVVGEGAAAGVQDVHHGGAIRVGDGVGFRADVHDAWFRGVLRFQADRKIVDIEGVFRVVTENINAEFLKEVEASCEGYGLAALHGLLPESQ